MKYRIGALRLLLAALLLVCLTWGQTGTGNIQGVVKDATGAVVPAAKVTIVHTPTSQQYDTTTNGVGFFVFPPVQRGPYDVSVSAPGMETWKGSITLLVGQTAELNVSLKVGVTATAVTVAGDVTPLVTTTSPTLSNVVEKARIEQLPVNGRYIQTLVFATTPGLEDTGYAPRVYGLRYASEYLSDGAVLTNRDWGGMLGRPPGLDSIQEFRVETNNSSAKLNRPGTIMMTTRGGTNEIHGSAFETARNSGIGVARRRQDYFTKAPHYVRNEFGGTFGAPVYLPKVYNGRNRTFFFASYEGYRYRTQSTMSVSMPTPAMMGGDFSGLIDSAGRSYTIYDPLTTTTAGLRTPFAGNKIDPARESPLTKYLYSVTPLPTLAGVNPLVGPNWFGLGFNNTNQDTFTTRVDHRISDRNQIFFRYTYSPSHTWYTSSLGGGPTTLDGKANAHVDDYSNHSGVASWTHSFSPTLFSETVFTVSRDYRGQLPITGYEEIDSKLGLPNPFNWIGFPRITSTGFGMDYDSSINVNINWGRIFNLDQNFTKVYGRHEFQFGGRFRYELLETVPDQQQQAGNPDFASLATAQYDTTTGAAYGSVPYTGHNAANFYMGYATYYALFNRALFRMQSMERSGYFQDNLKLTSRLTLNFGVRYEYNTPIKERDNTFIGFDPKTHAVVLSRPISDFVAMKDALQSVADAYGAMGLKYETFDQAGLPSSLVYPNRLDFGPRAGFAYRIAGTTHPTVLRGGYSVFAYPERLRSFNGEMQWTIPTRGPLRYNPNMAALSPDSNPNYWIHTVPNVIAGVNSANIIDVNKASGLTRGSSAMYYFEPHNPTARAHEWNITLEKEIFSDTVIKAAWAGTHGARMDMFYSYNDQPNSYIWYTTRGTLFPTGEYSGVAARGFDQQVLGAVWDYQKTGWSNDNSIQFEIQHRYSKGYAYQLFYVMSNATRAAGNAWVDDILNAPNVYLPGAVPDDMMQRAKLLVYHRDTDIPKHRVRWNWLVDLPFGKGKLVGRNAHGLAQALFGGWQIAGNGTLYSRYFSLPTSYWRNNAPVQIYGKQYPIQNCMSGTCYDGYLYWNAYIPANRINSYNAAGKPNGIMGVPSDYKPFALPFYPIPANGGTSSDPLYNYYDTNTVWIPLKDGTVQRTGYDNNLNPFRQQYFLAPMEWNLDASAFKAVQLKERLTLRVNVDFFNILNRPGIATPGSYGIVSNQYSDLSPRNLQLTMRLSW